jgi:ribA/ribD-fused uncharacterized protein
VSEPIYFYSKIGAFAELSNFAPFGFEADGVYWPTMEHFFQAQKFEDADYRERIRRATTPKEARSLGRSRAIPICSNWDSIRDEVMLRGLRLKFQRPKPREILLSTGDRELIEASPFDYYWGAGKSGTGKNRLGKLLMQVRDELRELSEAK